MTKKNGTEKAAEFWWAFIILSLLFWLAGLAISNWVLKLDIPYQGWLLAIPALFLGYLTAQIPVMRTIAESISELARFWH